MAQDWTILCNKKIYGPVSSIRLVGLVFMFIFKARRANLIDICNHFKLYIKLPVALLLVKFNIIPKIIIGDKHARQDIVQLATGRKELPF